MGLSQLAKQLSAWETRRMECLGVDIKIKRLSLSELQEVERLTEECSIGNGQNRHVGNLPKLVWTLVKRYVVDAEGNPLGGEDSVDDAKEWPASMVTELTKHFGEVNGTANVPN